MTGKEIYERRKRLKAERLLREEESATVRREHADEGEILIASIAASFESIAASLKAIAEKQT